MLSNADIRALSDKDLATEVENSRLLLFKHKMGVKTGHFKDSHIIRTLKKYIARLSTVLTSRKNLEIEVVDTSSAAKEKVAALHKDLASRQTIAEKGKKKAATKTSAKKAKEELTSND